ncbi:hypothetical protein D3874_04825 [Oleomonas cavernae]|uniref:Uncharacterized protein n=1 Tax=Oleomonas cavernae TaxID=2320859 RepID=A0A418W8U7_9PROT|nr:hypothetical protein [Oleomonas cavernae]RJF86433.1 hypothetical protein D3874_04825 [Oleomonas cavernae]
MYSRAHLLWENHAADQPTDALAGGLMAAGGPGSDDTSIYHRLARRLRHTGSVDSQADFAGLVRAILLGNGIGLASAYGSAQPALLLWAAAGRLMEILGIEHPNELIGPEPATE